MPKSLVNIDLNGLSLLNPVLNPLASAPANANPYYIYTSTAVSDKGTVYINVGTYASPSWSAIGAVKSVNGKIGVVTLTQDDVGNGSTYVRTHNDLTNALVTLINGALQKTGGTMSGAIAMGSNKITGLADGTADGDAVNKAQMEEAIRQSAGYFRGTYATKAALDAVAWQTTNPSGANYVTNNDYAVVLDDETHSDECWRYVYVTGTGWSAQYRINESPLTTAQLAAINSGITAALVAQIGTNQTAIGKNAEDIHDIIVNTANLEENATASQSYNIDDYFWWIYGGTVFALCKVVDPIEAGDTIAFDSNVEGVLAMDEVKAAKPKVETGTITGSNTSVSVPFSGNVLATYAIQNGEEVIVNKAIGSGSVTFSVASAPGSTITNYIYCIVVYV